MTLVADASRVQVVGPALAILLPGGPGFSSTSAWAEGQRLTLGSQHLTNLGAFNKILMHWATQQ